MAQLVALVGGCPAHGDDCKPHVLEKVRELVRLHRPLTGAHVETSTADAPAIVTPADGREGR